MMRNSTTLRWLNRSAQAGVVVSAALFGMKAMPEDIDIFAGGANVADIVPSILLAIDNTANFSASEATFRCNINPVTNEVRTDGGGLAANFTALDKTTGGVQQCALYSVLSKLGAPGQPGFKLGLMTFNANGIQQYNPSTKTFSNTCRIGNASNGGCLLMEFTEFNSTTKDSILDYIRRWEASGNSGYNIKGNASTASGALMQEAWAYYYRKTGISGRNYSSFPNDPSCGGKNVIFVANAWNTQGRPNDATQTGNPRDAFLGTDTPAKNADPVTTTAQRSLTWGSVQTQCSAQATVVPAGVGDGVYALNWARYMKAQDITTFSVGLLGPSCDAGYAAHLERLGDPAVGGGGFFATNNFAQLEAAFNNAFARILATNTVFASVSLPVSVNTQGSFLNQVFVGQFRPDASFLPRWNGNLKQYKLAAFGTDIRTVDADDQSAINNTTGFISECARSFWTPKWDPANPDDYWSLAPSGACGLSSDPRRGANTPDGNIVEKGAQAQSLRAMTPPSSRVVKTCSPSGCTSLTDFDDGNTAITATDLGAANATARTNMINWARGLNNRNGDAELQKALTVMRPSVHGDVVHSRPVAVNYGTDTAPSIVVFYGGNDGLLRAINGNRGVNLDGTVKATDDIGSVKPGGELWSFMPPEFYGSIKRIYDNTRGIWYPNGPNGRTTADGKPDRKTYGMDGPITAFSGDIPTVGDDRKYVFATMRRGGRAIYAFDVTTPASPSLLWRVGCSSNDDATCTNDSTKGDFRGIGQTWSSVKTMFATSYNSGTRPLVVFGGGYDNCEDVDVPGTLVPLTVNRNHECTSSSKGRAIYVLDAVTGNQVRTPFATERGVIADVTLVSDANGKAVYGYTADLGGNVYRINFSGASPADWTITKIAALGCDNPVLGSCNAAAVNRKFMFAPSVVTKNEDVAAANAEFNILIGSGDREKPVKDYVVTQGVVNHFFMLKDRPKTADWLTAEATFGGCGLGSNVLCKASLVEITPGVKPTSTVLDAKKGWYLKLDSGEQVVTSAITLFGVTSFSTSKPPVVEPGVCVGNLGTTRVYNVNYLNAFSATDQALPYAVVAGGGLPPSPVGGLVTLDNGKTVPFCIGCSADSPLAGKLAGALTDTVRPINRTYWYITK